MSEVTVVIPTFKRPEGLRRAVESLLQQSGAPEYSIMIVDNDPAASAKDVCGRLRALAGDVDTQYIHEPNPGVANARNAAIKNVSTDLVAFLDDDQSAPETWLHELTKFHASMPAPITFGPVITQLPSDVIKHNEYLEAFFARKLDSNSGYIDHYYGCGNALLNLSLINFPGPLFDPAMNESGGEDDLLFQAIKESGERFGWCAEAPAFEHVPPSRARLNYALKRAFAYGQGPITLARKARPTRYSSIVMWMLIGAGKCLLNSALYLGHWIARTPNRAQYLDRAVRGAGKMFWWVKLRFYGASAITTETLDTSNRSSDQRSVHPNVQHS